MDEQHIFQSNAVNKNGISRIKNKKNFMADFHKQDSLSSRLQSHNQDTIYF